MSSSAYAIQDIKVCSDQIVAEPKCNADEQIFSRPPPQALTSHSPRLSQLRARDQCRVCARAAPRDIAAILDPAQFAGAASSL